MTLRIQALISLVFAAALMLTGCNQDKQVNTTLDLLDKTTTEMVSKIESGDDRKAGVDAAQKYLDEHKSELGDAMKDISELRGFEVSEEAQNRLASSLIDNVAKVEGLKLDYLTETMKDDELDKKLEALIDDYGKVVAP